MHHFVTVLSEVIFRENSFVMKHQKTSESNFTIRNHLDYWNIKSIWIAFSWGVEETSSSSLYFKVRNPFKYLRHKCKTYFPLRSRYDTRDTLGNLHTWRSVESIIERLSSPTFRAIFLLVLPHPCESSNINRSFYRVWMEFDANDVILNSTSTQRALEPRKKRLLFSIFARLPSFDVLPL